MGFITKEGLKALDNYKYKSGGYTKLDMLLNPFWEWVQKQIPRWVAPNLVTLTGFILMITSYIIMIFYDTTFTKLVPSWVYIIAAIFQVIYHTLDAVDGKHARETKSSSPLGQLFDHGCDSFSASFLILSVSQTLRLGPTDELLFFFCIVQFGFYMANWGEYHSGVLRTGMSNFGVTEGQLLIAGAIMANGVISTEFWNFTLYDGLKYFGYLENLTKAEVHYLLTVRLSMWVLRTIYCALFLIIIVFITTTLRTTEKSKVHAVLQYIPLFLNILISKAYLWSRLPIFQQYAALIMLISGLIFSLNTSKLIVCSLTHMQTPYLQVETVIFYFGYEIAHRLLSTKPNSQENLLIILAIYVTGAAISWAKGSIEQISSYLGIYCLSLKKRERKLD